MSIGHSVVRRRGMMRSFFCFFGGGNLSWLGLRWTSVVMMRWKSMEYILQAMGSPPIPAVSKRP